ncbi:beta-N-acetylhexosaminidase [Lewinellaceae bacterium SD302]|nr:beta-N-acetylhexosaminidase [Lewinellaceae bacterium SD302]
MTAQSVYQADLSKQTPTEKAWVDSVYNSMDFDQQIGQLFMIRAHSDLGADHIAGVEKMIRENHVGGLCFFQGTPEKQLELTNRYQALSKLPLMVSMDAEWGFGMRMPESTISFPKQLALGAIRDNRKIYDMGAEIARQLRRMGVHVSFSPVLDVNNNPDNPVIATRSFGEDRYNVTVKSYNYMKGLQDNGVMACAKHFPGHGDTDVDSHYDLPVIRHDRARLDSIELYPFKALARYGIGSFMIAHLAVPELEPRTNRPTSLSKAVTTDLLRGEMNFTGLVFTDALEMKGVTKYFGEGEVEAESLLAGNDILLLPGAMGAAKAAIRRYLDEGKLTSSDIESKVRRVLLAKYRLGLTAYRPLAVENVRAQINSEQAHGLKQELFAASVTLLRNNENILPIGNLDRHQIASVRVGVGEPTAFTRRLEDYASVKQLSVAAKPSEGAVQTLMQQLGRSNLVIVSIYSDGSRFREHVKISPEIQSLLRRIGARAKLVIAYMGNPYGLGPLDEFGTVVLNYSRDDVAQDVLAQAIFGAEAMSGRLPVTASGKAQFNQGLSTAKGLRMGFAPAGSVGMEGSYLHQSIERIAKECIDERAAPGLVALVARQGKIIYQNSFGHHTYGKNRSVKTSDLYDLASVTKVAATTLAIMKLVDEEKVNLDAPLGDYLVELKGSNKESLTLRSMLAHRSGLRSWIPFYVNTLTPNSRVARPSSQFYRKTRTGDFVVPVTNELFMHRTYIDSIWHQIRESPLPNLGEYRYSDLGFYLMARLVNRVSGMQLDEYVDFHFYRPMGLKNLQYLPWQKNALDRIVPSENDNYFRQATVRGYVHDMGAAMLGGVSGHAGLFGTAADIAVVFQMLIQNGNYGGRSYLSSAVIQEFTDRYPGETRRGLGFDMKQLDPNRNMNMSNLASERTFGHTGFTGTCVWADPDEDLVFVFLSNRTFPSMKNTRLNRMDIRPRMHSAAYLAINKTAARDEVARLYTTGP